MYICMIKKIHMLQNKLRIFNHYDKIHKMVGIVVGHDDTKQEMGTVGHETHCHFEIVGHRHVVERYLDCGTWTEYVRGLVPHGYFPQP